MSRQAFLKSTVKPAQVLNVHFTHQLASHVTRNPTSLMSFRDLFFHDSSSTRSICQHVNSDGNEQRP